MRLIGSTKNVQRTGRKCATRAINESDVVTEERRLVEDHDYTISRFSIVE